MSLTVNSHFVYGNVNFFSMPCIQCSTTIEATLRLKSSKLKSMALTMNFHFVCGNVNFFLTTKINGFEITKFNAMWVAFFKRVRFA